MASLASTPFAPFRRPRIRLRLCSSPSPPSLFAFALLPSSLSLSLSLSSLLCLVRFSFYHVHFCSLLTASPPRFTSCRSRSLCPLNSHHPSRSFSSIQMAKVNFAITKYRARRSPRYGATILAQPTPPPPSGEAPIWSRE